MANFFSIMFIRTWWIKSQLKSRNSSRLKKIEKKLCQDDRYWVSVVLQKLIRDFSLEVRNASVRILNQKGWRPIVVSDLKALVQIPDPSANALIRQFKGSFQEEIQAIEILLKINPARAVSFLARVCASYHGDIVKKCANILEKVLRQYADQIDTEDLKIIANLKDELVVEYHPGSGLASSYRRTTSSLPIRSLAKAEHERRSIK